MTRGRLAADVEELAWRVNVAARLKDTVRRRGPYLIGAAVVAAVAAVAIWRT